MATTIIPMIIQLALIFFRSKAITSSESISGKNPGIIISKALCNSNGTLPKFKVSGVERLTLEAKLYFGVFRLTYAQDLNKLLLPIACILIFFRLTFPGFFLCSILACSRLPFFDILVQCWCDICIVMLCAINYFWHSFEKYPLFCRWQSDLLHYIGEYLFF